MAMMPEDVYVPSTQTLRKLIKQSAQDWSRTSDCKKSWITISPNELLRILTNLKKRNEKIN